VKLPRRTFLHMAAGAAALPAISRIALAQTYPVRPVRVIEPVAAGGSTDLATRIVADHLSRALGQQFVVDNRAGAGGTVAIEGAARSAPDGYTILVSTDRVASLPHVYKLNTDPTKTLLPVIQVSRQPVVLAVHPSLGVNSLSELVALAKREPGLGCALGGGFGAQQHIVIEWFARLANIKLEAIPYRGGGQAINDLIAGHVKIGSLGSSPLIPFYKTGALRLLAQSSEARSASLPEIPTYQEAGIKGLVLDQWIGAFVPAGTPQPIIARLNTEINKALADPTVRDNLLQQAQDPVGGTVEQFAHLFQDDFAKYEGLVRKLNIKAE
jgi:tripartite-type tricarboxylate transporter receptor subunit TctC